MQTEARRSVLAVASAAAREAGAVLLEHYGKLDPAAIHSKSAGRDLVTAADVAAERRLVQRLRKHFPEHAIEAEEEVKDALDRRPRWFLDPLDGTVNFVHKLPAFSVSMGHYAWSERTHKLEPEVAVVYLPLFGEMFTAIAGEGAFLNGAPLRVSGTPVLRDSILATGFPYRRNELEHNNLANFNRFFLDVRGIRRFGSAAMDLAYVAAGRFDGYWELHLSPHDVAAGALLVREAGGIVTDCDGGDDWLRAGHLVAANATLQPLIRARIVH
jgi:myo-inositol-1(or 4)-monophosphatase